MTTRIYIPDNSQIIEREGLPLIVYTYTNSKGKPAAVAYKAKAYRPLWNYYFQNEEQRTKRIESTFSDVAQHEASKKERKTSRTAYKHDVKPGDIFYASWGYEQTNIDFYEVTATTEKTVTFRKIAQDREYNAHWMTGTCTPKAGAFIGKPYTRTVNQYGRIHFSEYPGGLMFHLSRYDGTPKGYSDYA